MATSGTQTDFVIYDEQFNSKLYERLNINIDLWNAKTNGGLLLTTKDMMGHFSKVTMYKKLASAVVTEYDPRTKGTTTWSNLETFENASVKVWRDMAIEGTLDEFKVMLNEPNATFSELVGALTAQLITEDAIETLVGALAGAIENDTTHIVGDYTAAMTFKDINKARFIYGDQFSKVKCILVHSDTAQAIADLNIDEKLDVIAGYSIQTGSWSNLGIPMIISDINSLKDGVNFKALFLTEGAGMAMSSEKVTAITQIDIDSRPMTMKFKREWAFNIGLKGYTYDTTKTAYPTKANLADPTYWTRTCTDDKDLPCVLFKAIATS